MAEVRGRLVRQGDHAELFVRSFRLLTHPELRARVAPLVRGPDEHADERTIAEQELDYALRPTSATIRLSRRDVYLDVTLVARPTGDAATLRVVATDADGGRSDLEVVDVVVVPASGVPLFPTADRRPRPERFFQWPWTIHGPLRGGDTVEVGLVLVAGGQHAFEQRTVTVGGPP